MKLNEFVNILIAVLILTIVSGFSFALDSKWTAISQLFLFSLIVIFVSVFAKKFMAYLLDADVEHTIWKASRWGYKQHQHLKKEIPAGVIFPLFLTLFSLGWIKFTALLTYEARALKRRAARRFGFYSYTELTEWHNALIGAAGIISVFIIIIITYFLPFAGADYLAKIAAYYALCNLIPLSKLDGAQIFFGSRVLYTTLAVITLIFASYAFIL